MRAIIFLIPLFLVFGACAEEPPPPTGPIYLGATPEVWAKNITSTDLREQEVELNRLALGRTDVIPVLIELLAHEDKRVIEGAYRALDANLNRVDDVAPWIPALKAATKAADPEIRGMAERELARIEGGGKPEGTTQE